MLALAVWQILATSLAGLHLLGACPPTHGFCTCPGGSVASPSPEVRPGCSGFLLAGGDNVEGPSRAPSRSLGSPRTTLPTLLKGDSPGPFQMSEETFAPPYRTPWGPQLWSGQGVVRALQPPGPSLAFWMCRKYDVYGGGVGILGMSEIRASVHGTRERSYFQLPMCQALSCQAKNPFIAQGPPRRVCLVCVDFGMWGFLEGKQAWNFTGTAAVGWGGLSCGLGRTGRWWGRRLTQGLKPLPSFLPV